MIGFALGLAYANAVEWVTHKHILHGRNLGKKKGTFWAFHFHEHHAAVRTHGHVDAAYNTPWFRDPSRAKEVLSLAGVAALHLPLFPVAPGFTIAAAGSAYWYYRVHKRSHLDPEWAREHLPWHYDHHMGRNQDANWCVTWPWFDWVMGTREPYVGTALEAADLDKARRKRERAARRSA